MKPRIFLVKNHKPDFLALLWISLWIGALTITAQLNIDIDRIRWETKMIYSECIIQFNESKGETYSSRNYSESTQTVSPRIWDLPKWALDNYSLCCSDVFLLLVFAAMITLWKTWWCWYHLSLLWELAADLITSQTINFKFSSCLKNGLFRRAGYPFMFTFMWMKGKNTIDFKDSWGRAQGQK